MLCQCTRQTWPIDFNSFSHVLKVRSTSTSTRPKLFRPSAPFRSWRPRSSWHRSRSWSQPLALYRYRSLYPYSYWPWSWFLGSSWVWFFKAVEILGWVRSLARLTKVDFVVTLLNQMSCSISRCKRRRWSDNRRLNGTRTENYFDSNTSQLPKLTESRQEEGNSWSWNCQMPLKVLNHGWDLF